MLNSSPTRGRDAINIIYYNAII